MLSPLLQIRMLRHQEVSAAEAGQLGPGKGRRQEDPWGTGLLQTVPWATRILSARTQTTCHTSASIRGGPDSAHSGRAGAPARGGPLRMPPPLHKHTGTSQTISPQRLQGPAGRPLFPPEWPLKG